MTDLSPTSALLLVLWGTLVGLDLVSVPQAMMARPGRRGRGGRMAGGRRRGRAPGRRALRAVRARRAAGGAVRYPDYGPATVAAVALAGGLALAVRARSERRARPGPRRARRVQSPAGAAGQRAGHPAPLRRAGGRRERRDPPASVRLAAPRRGSRRRCSRPSASHAPAILGDPLRRGSTAPPRWGSRWWRWDAGSPPSSAARCGAPAAAPGSAGSAPAPLVGLIVAALR